MLEMFELPTELYTMNRGVKFDKHLPDYRYDITVIPPIIINGHYNKTKGHIHTKEESEKYQVLEGKAIFLFQKNNDAYYIKAKKLDIVNVPGDYYHFTINPTNKVLKLANWIEDSCKSDYSMIEKKKGAMYYYTTKGWKKNPNYKKVPKLRQENATNL